MAELAKVQENMERDLNIALVSEPALIMDRLALRIADCEGNAGTVHRVAAIAASFVTNSGTSFPRTCSTAASFRSVAAAASASSIGAKAA